MLREIFCMMGYAQVFYKEFFDGHVQPHLRSRDGENSTRKSSSPAGAMFSTLGFEKSGAGLYKSSIMRHTSLSFLEYFLIRNVFFTNWKQIIEGTENENAHSFPRGIVRLRDIRIGLCSRDC
jgi:hypothetical protein